MARVVDDVASTGLLCASHRSTIRHPLIQGNTPGLFYISRSAKFISNSLKDHTTQRARKIIYGNSVPPRRARRNNETAEQRTMKTSSHIGREVIGWR